MMEELSLANIWLRNDGEFNLFFILYLPKVVYNCYIIMTYGDMYRFRETKFYTVHNINLNRQNASVEVQRDRQTYFFLFLNLPFKWFCFSYRNSFDDETHAVMVDYTVSKIRFDLYNTYIIEKSQTWTPHVQFVFGTSSAFNPHLIINMHKSMSFMTA